ncbi:Gfo/Idh/MocA family protein [Halalkalibacterium ligniniphilum]|uniref:Gfo/Idh/MocA family protein n=1 Tax=Halalkalibacterium ligniniphilum TaxID=1134413 RepID=UPI000348D6C3|nr:Gfo/Idh/MocA family oxidoreductase [Halalkalibacterium ligniniphilum]
MREREIRVGIAGLGIAGTEFISYVERHPKMKVSAAATRDKKRREEFEKDFQARAYESVEAMCESNEIDVIYIATPTELHKEHVFIAAENRKHVIVEKPMATSLDEATSMIDICERNDAHLLVGHSHSFELPIIEMKKVIDSGQIGDVRMIHNLYYNDWIYRPRTPEELNTSLGGGVTFRQGSHQFDIIRFLGGGKVRSVRASTGRWDKERDTEGSHSVWMEFENGVTATAIYNGYDHFHSTELTNGLGEGGPVRSNEPYGNARKQIKRTMSPMDEIKQKNSRGYQSSSKATKQQKPKNHPFFGLTIVSCERGDIRQSPNGIFVYGENEKEEILIPTTTNGRDVVLNEMYEAIVNDAPIIHDGRWARANLEVCIASLRSAELKKEIILDYQVPV